jgi:hypothetical protein
MEICVDSSYHREEINARIKAKTTSDSDWLQQISTQNSKTPIAATCWRLFFFRESSTGTKRVANRYSESLQNKMLSR